MPVHAHTRCRTCTRAVVAASPSLNSGISVVTGVSQANLPSSTCFASISVVSALLLEAIMKTVDASTLPGLPSSRTPKPPANTTLPCWTMPIATPGTSKAMRASSMKRVSVSMRARSSACARLPAKVSGA